MKDSADPIQGWQIEEVIEKVTLAKNDIYGSLFIYLQDILLQFCRCIHSHKVHFRLFQVDAVLLPKMLELPEVGQCSFDKIEVIIQSNIYCLSILILIFLALEYSGSWLPWTSCSSRHLQPLTQTKDTKPECCSPDLVSKCGSRSIFSQRLLELTTL